MNCGLCHQVEKVLIVNMHKKISLLSTQPLSIDSQQMWNIKRVIFPSEHLYCGKKLEEPSKMVLDLFVMMPTTDAD